MVTFVNFMERLARGQLKNTSAAENSNLGEICPDYHATILSLTNEGLVEISTKLPIVRKLVDLTFVEDQFQYPLVNGANYLDTTGLEDFLDDAFVKVLDIYDATGKRYQPNTAGHITTPVFNSLRFTAAVMNPLDTLYIGPKVRIQYQAKYVTILQDGSIDLPPNLITALQLYVASRYIADMGGKENEARGDGYLALFLRHVTEDEVRNTSGTSEVHEDDRFTANGFV